MRKLVMVVCAFAGLAIYATVATSAEDLAAAVKERRHLMKEVVAPATKLGGQMVRDQGQRGVAEDLGGLR